MASETRPPDFRLVVTGGLHGFHSGAEAFYLSPLFRLGKSSLIEINDAHLQAYSAQDTVYFSSSSINPKKLLEPVPVNTQGSFSILEASEFFGLKISENKPAGFTAVALGNELGGVPVQVQYETKKFGNQIIYAVNLAASKKQVHWPSEISELKKVTGALASDKSQSSYYFFPRLFRSTKTTFQLVDEMLQDKSSPARYIDLGNALTNGTTESPLQAIEMSQLLQARKPVALALGRYDLNVLPQIEHNSPYIGAFTGDGAPQISRRVRMGNAEVRILALGNISNVATGFLPPQLKPMTVRQSIESVKFLADDIVIGLSENRQTASEAIEYPLLDLVLSLANLRGGSLPAKDDINLTENHQLGVRTVAPLVRISSSDVTEVSIWMKSPGQIQRILVHRKPLLGGISTSEHFYSAALPNKEWRENDYSTLLSNVLLNKYTSAEFVIIQKRLSVTPINSSLPMPLADELIAPEGRAVVITLGGTYLKQLLKAIKEEKFDLSVNVTSTLTRPIYEPESYKIVVTEKVLAAISDFIARESLFAVTSNPASSLQTALLESRRESIKILTELRKRENKASPTLEDRSKLLEASTSISQLVQQAILERTPLEKRPERNALILDISDLDFGLKLNHVNQTLSLWQTEGEKSYKAAFDENRFWDPKYLNVLFNTKIGLYYVMPRLQTGLIAGVKYFQPNTESNEVGYPEILQTIDPKKIRPAKDSVKLEAEALIPISWYVSPLTRLTYETQLWPNALLTDLPKAKWPRRVNDLRLFLGGSLKPWWGYELFRAGALLGYDFSRDTAAQSFGYGFEFGGCYRKEWRYFGFRIDTNFRKLFPIVADPDVGRMGIVWLTDARVEIPIVAGFSASALTNLTIGERMDQPGKLGVGTVFGLALSYGDVFKWLH